ncbi:Uncharacterised protein [Legionella wadsworthii]|uniref:Uncharacterized protein n=1 Tax=Legionella wadsworthii TaxID=28088 RepID=A0A378LNS4_9GAMM|nr:Uncharacterised protein [Legionella wadsworthii]
MTNASIHNMHAKHRVELEIQKQSYSFMFPFSIYRPTNISLRSIVYNFYTQRNLDFRSYRRQQLTKEHLILLSKILNKYRREIPFAQDMLGEIEKLLTNEQINYDLILALAMQHPVTDLIRYFGFMERQDVNSLISCVRNVFQEAVAEKMKGLESMNSYDLAVLSAKLSNNKLKAQMLERDGEDFEGEDLDKERNKTLTEIYESYYCLLATGNSEQSPLFSRIIGMRVPIIKTMDKMLVQFAKYNTYYEDSSINVSIVHSNKRFDYISVGTDQCVQYDPANSSYYQLQPPNSAQEMDSPWKATKKEVEGFEPKLMSVRITNCHNVLIRDIATNRFWLLHVSPGSIHGKNPISDFPVKNAYIDLQPQYSDKNMGIDKNTQLEVIVVDKKGYFNEELLRKRVPGNIVSLKVITPSIEMPEVLSPNEEHQYMYHVCFNPKQNLLVVKQNDTYLEYADVFTLSLDHSIENTSQEEMRYSSLAQRFGINAERTRAHLSETRIEADTVENDEKKIGDIEIKS